MNSFEIRGNRVLLRDPYLDDVDAYIRWMTVERKWGDWDAPWEKNEPASPDKSEERRKRVSQAFSITPPDPRQVLYIQLINGPILGWVNQYHYSSEKSEVWIGINICESKFWGQGLGTEAFQLWIDYIFSNLDVDVIKTATWSGNVRMVRCAEKCGFHLIEKKVNARFVRGAWYDGVTFSHERCIGNILAYKS